MQECKHGRTGRRSRIAATLLMSSTLCGAAFAQDDAAAAGGAEEEIVVTAQRSGAAQSVQRIPIAVTAMSQTELEAKSIESFKDLQFNVPSVTYSNGNFGGNNFQIRGVGISSVATSADSGVSVHTNDVYVLGTAGLATGEYYDLERIEILRGPQSTLYGRNATGGVVNIITAKPNTAEQMYSADLTYGEYNTVKANLMANLPIVTDELAVRIAYNYNYHDGYVENLFTGNDANSQGLHQVRYSLRWTPSESTTIDFMGSYAKEKDRRMRYPKQQCHRDPTGVLGCLPDARGFEAVNSDSGFGTLLSSQSSFNINIPGVFSFNFGPYLGLADVLDPIGGNANSVVPRDNLKIAADYDPIFEADSVFYMGSLEQELTPWLKMTALVNYSDGESLSRSHYNNLVGDDFSARLTEVAGNMQLLSSLFTGSTGAADRYISTFFTAPDGSLALPTSIPGSGGVMAGPQDGKTVTYGTRAFGYDQIDGSGDQFTTEVRFNSDFDGPLNFLLAGFYINAESDTTYWVNNNMLDYAGIQYGFIQYLLAGGTGDLLVQGPTQFRSYTALNKLESRALFGEVYWEINDELKLTGGLRWLEDKKRVVAQTTLLNFTAPVGTQLDQFDYFLQCCSSFDADPSKPGQQIMADQDGKFSQVTGRAVLEWTPDVEWSDSTLVYLSYARGFKSGGINPPISPDVPIDVPLTFDPETIDAYEIGTKNRFMDNALTVNLTAYYYDYKGYQIADIIARTAVNSNIDATVWGLEGEFLYRPDDNWTFNMTLAHTDTEIGDASIVDQRNPTAGLANAIAVKDISNGAGCVILMDPSVGGVTPAQAGVPGFHVPPGGVTALQGAGVAYVNFGSCTASLPTGYSYAPDGSGVRQSIKGNELPQQPGNTISIGAQYVWNVSEEYELVMRGDWYWQDKMWSRIINGPADRIDSWDVLNVSVQLNAIDQDWYAKLWATNVLDSRELTGVYLTDSSSGLFSNVFVQDPRVVGLTVGYSF